jgi:hypothetical protein
MLLPPCRVSAQMAPSGCHAAYFWGRKIRDPTTWLVVVPRLYLCGVPVPKRFHEKWLVQLGAPFAHTSDLAIAEYWTMDARCGELLLPSSLSFCSSFRGHHRFHARLRRSPFAPPCGRHRFHGSSSLSFCSSLWTSSFPRASSSLSFCSSLKFRGRHRFHGRHRRSPFAPP